MVTFSSDLTVLQSSKGKELQVANLKPSTKHSHSH